MKNILAIDTATDACSVALQCGEQTFSRYDEKPQQHTKLILSMCDSLLAESGITLNDVDLVVCGRGPGSFTGVRIGIAVAQGISYGIGCNLLGISDLETIAQGVASIYTNNTIIVASDAKMNEVYFAIFRSNNGELVSIEEEKVIDPNKAKELICKHCISSDANICCGTGFIAYEVLEKLMLDSNKYVDYTKCSLPNALNMFKLVQKYQKDAGLPEQLVPVYLRDKVTWKKISEQKAK